MSKASLYDGRTAQRHDVDLALSGRHLELRHKAENRKEALRAEELELLPQQKGNMVIGHRARHGWRLVFDQGPPPLWLRHLGVKEPSRIPGWVRRQNPGALAAVVGGFIALSIVLYQLGTSGVAALVPPKAARAVGEAAIAALVPERNFCTAAEGQAALNRLSGKLRKTIGASLQIEIRVADKGMVNAFAAPGGQVVIMRGLIDKTDNPAALAGVLAHEIGHAKHKHGLRAVIRALGVGVILQALGGDIGGIANQLLSLSYSRAFERQADNEALQALEILDIDPAPFADFFKAIAKKREGKLSESGLAGYLSTHPLSGERAARIRAWRDPKKTYQPVMDAADWQAIKTICETPSAERD